MKQDTKREISHIAKRINEILDTCNPSSATPPPSSMAGGSTPVPDEIGNHPQSTNEQIAGTPPQASVQTAQQKPLASDVQSLQRATANAGSVSKASGRINTSTEFPQAFKVWFGTLGYNPQNKAITIQRVRTEVEKAMREMGYR